jgi:hypothetical protein
MNAGHVSEPGKILLSVYSFRRAAGRAQSSHGPACMVRHRPMPGKQKKTFVPES